MCGFKPLVCTRRNQYWIQSVIPVDKPQNALSCGRHLAGAVSEIISVTETNVTVKPVRGVYATPKFD